MPFNPFQKPRSTKNCKELFSYPNTLTLNAIPREAIQPISHRL